MSVPNSKSTSFCCLKDPENSQKKLHKSRVINELFNKDLQVKLTNDRRGRVMGIMNQLYKPKSKPSDDTTICIGDHIMVVVEKVCNMTFSFDLLIIK